MAIKRQELNQDRPVWEQQDDETKPVYDKFVIYRDMEERRLTDSRLGANARELSARWQWAYRVLEWDRHVAREEAEMLIRTRISMNRRHRQVARAAQAKISQWLVNVDISKLKPAEAARWYELAVRIEREASGANLPDAHFVPTEPDTRNPLDDVSMAELLGVEEGQERIALREMYDRVKASVNGDSR